EEKTALSESGPDGAEAEIDDIHLGSAVRLDQYTVPGQPWFEHLKQFVDQGVSAFKLDGAFFVNEHPDRLWAGKYLDQETHNLLPLVYGRQMSHGYTAHTGERAMINIPMGYTGIQQYCATWAGDTGGGADALVSMLNLGFCGIANTSCDIRVTDIESIHFGFLLPWTQQNNWNYWLQPWLLGKAQEDAIRFYARFRSQLFPYLYACGHIAAETGMPLMRSMTLSWPDEAAYDEILTQYMLGDGLLVSAFCDSVTLPAGAWYDVWTGERILGGISRQYSPPSGRGGGLFARAGAIIPMQPWAPCLERFQPDQIDLHIYPGGDFSLDLIEDDGITCRYREEQIARTPITIRSVSSTSYRLSIGRRTGSYPGMPAVTAFCIKIHQDEKPVVEDQDKTEVIIVRQSGCWSFVVSSAWHNEADLTFDCRFD
ncbi:MAG: glycoside hydrolase family 31 protein, partial [Bacillota bacterium]|nr:glycoside hydrolase family 31 protein [Bacillota bacterium]